MIWDSLCSLSAIGEPFSLSSCAGIAVSQPRCLSGREPAERLRLNFREMQWQVGKRQLACNAAEIR